MSSPFTKKATSLNEVKVTEHSVLKYLYLIYYNNIECVDAWKPKHGEEQELPSDESFYFCMLGELISFFPTVCQLNSQIIGSNVKNFIIS